MFGINREALTFIAGLSIFLFTAMGCSIGTPSKPLHYYTLDAGENGDPPETDFSGSGANAAVVVEPFQAPDVYRDPSMIWRDRRHLQRFQYNHWASPPPELMGQFVAGLLRRNLGGPVDWVTTAETQDSGAHFFIRGTIRDLYLTRTKNGSRWKGVARVRLQLLERSVRGDEPAGTSGDERSMLGSWTLTGSGTVDAPPGEPQTPDAMNDLLDRLSASLTEDGRRISAEIQSKVERTLNEREKKPEDR